MRIIIIGIQGSGKSTQGKLLANELQVPYLSTGDVFRNLSKEDSEEGRFIQEKLRNGILIPDDTVNRIIETYLQKKEFQNGYVLDGFPRTVAQAQFFTQPIDYVLYLKLSDDVAKQRIAKRTDKRDDETADAINRRIRLFHERTEPVIAYYKEKNKLVEIDGEPSITEISEHIKQVIAKK